MTIDKTKYIGKNCKLILQGPYYYSGTILNMDDNFIVIHDFKTDKNFTLSVNAIISLGEIE